MENILPVHLGYDYAALLVGCGGSRVITFVAEAGGRVSIVVHNRKQIGITRNADIKDEAPHILLTGEHACTVKAERLINDLWKFQPISSEIVIPATCDYPRMIIGLGGRVKIRVRDAINADGWNYMNEPPYLLIEGKASCVCKVESMIMDL